MKVRAFRTPRPIMAGVAQTRTVLRGFNYLLHRRWPWGILLVLAAAGLGLLLFPHDRSLLARLHGLAFAQEAFAQKIAWFFGFWGDYPTFNLPFALGLWLYGAWKKNGALRRLAVIAFVGASLAGLFDDCFRLTLGRPRPDSPHPDGFYGLPDSLNHHFESFPSGHAAACFGAAIALLVNDLSWGVFVTAYTLFVVWARMELNRHYPSDVAVGSLIGISIGLLVGFGAKARWRLPLPAFRTGPVPAPLHPEVASPAIVSASD